MKYICPICGTEVKEFMDECPVCHWEVSGWDNDLTEEEQRNPDETPNPVSIVEARRLYSQGKDIYGDPLSKKQ